MKKFLTSLFTPELRTAKIDSDPPGTADINIGSSLNANGHTFYGFPEPVNGDWVATKNYVDRLNTKQICRVATTADIALSGLQTIDGSTLVAGDRVLVKNESPSFADGIYIASTGSWGRAPDADTGTELSSAFVWVKEGTVNANTAWLQTVSVPDVDLGTTPMLWVKKLGTGAINSSDIGFNAIYQGHIVDGEVTIPKLSATGTPSSTTYLRGDNTWATPAGSGGIPPYGVAEQNTGVVESLTNSALEQIPLTLKESSDITWTANEFVITQAGLYAISGGGTIALGGTAGRRMIEVTLNTALLARFEVNTSIRTTGTVYRLARLAVSDALRLQALQTSGGALDFSSAWLTLHRVIS